MPPPETNPAHIYRACLRECGYLRLPECRAYMREFTIQKFRNFIPRQSPRKRRDGRTDNEPPKSHLPPEKIVRLLQLARKFAAVIKRANGGYSTSLEKVLRMTYGRVGPQKFTLLEGFLNNDNDEINRDVTSSNIRGDDDGLQRLLDDDESEAEEWVDDKDTLYPSLTPTVSTTTFTTFYKPAASKKPSASPLVEENPPPWKQDLSPRLQALLASQSNEQPHFSRVGATNRVKLKFNPPAQTIWGKPLPMSRYKNQRMKWYDSNMKAALPPLETQEAYWALHDLVSGKRDIPPPIPRRPSPRKTPEEIEAESLHEQSEIILQGPKSGPRLKDWQSGRPHEITARFLQKMLSRVVLMQTPLVGKAAPGTSTEADSGLVVYWDDGLSRDRSSRAQERIQVPVPDTQAELLFT